MNSSVLQNHYEQVAALFAANGMQMDAQTFQYLAPLLEGEMKPEDHEMLLLAALARSTDE